MNKPAAELKQPHIVLGDDADKFSLENLYARLQDAFEKIIDQIEKSVDDALGENQPLLPLISHDLRVASPGLYVDTVMGVSPATEPYAEEMRAQKVLLEVAEVAKQNAIADYYRVLSGQPPLGSGSGEVPKVLFGYIMTDSKIAIELEEIVSPGIWRLEVDGIEITSFNVENAQKRIEIELGEVPDWLPEPEGHLISIRSKRTFFLVDLKRAV